MKQLLAVALTLFIASFAMDAFSQSQDWEKAWKQVDSLKRDNLFKDARKVVDELYVQAREQALPLQQIKALSYLTQFEAVTGQNADSTNIARLEAALDEMEGNARSILTSLLAEVYWAYYQNHRYQILERTYTEEAPEDFQTWDMRRFMDKISQLYFLSLADKKSLQATPVREVELILRTQKESPTYRPTLYDLLAHRAIDFFITGTSELVQPKNPFVLKDTETLIARTNFIRKKWPTTDTTSFRLYTLQLFQELLRLHGEGEDPSALIDVELKRFAYLKGQAVGGQKDRLYLLRLKELAELYRIHPASAEVNFAIAREYEARVERQEGSEEITLKAAHALATSAMEKFPESFGARQCQLLLKRLEAKHLSAEVEEAHIPGQPIPLMVGYKNLDKVFLTVYPEIDFSGARTQKEKIDRLKSATPIRAGRSLSLRDEQDFTGHTTIVPVKALTPGTYTLVVNSEESLDGEGLISYAILKSTRIAVTKKVAQDEERSMELRVVDRESGKPLKGAKVTAFTWDYNNPERAPVGPPQETDAQGYIKIRKGESEGRYLGANITYLNNDYLLGRTFMPSAYSDNRYRPEVQSYLFTDRKIYRPGQTIYFKALVLSRQDQQPEIKAKHPVEVRFFDPNQQEVGKLKLTTNEFGSVQGSFVAPQTGLTGNMRLVVEGGATSISVEEYKRPKFETTFLPITGTYQLNSEVAVTGQAKAYAGSNIDGAIVRYRVIRETSYPYFWGYFRRPYPRTPQQEILSGETSTDAEGKFTFTFEAQPDPQSERDLLPVFRYQISADVVDISGETQSASTALSIGYTSLQADWNVPKTVDLARAEKFDLSITNLSGQKARASTQLVLQALQAPKRNFRPRKWTEVDQHILSQAEFYEKFPFDQYEDEGKPENWTATTLRTRTIEVEGKSTQDWSDWLTDLDPGHYALEWTINDPSGELIKKKAILEVVNSDRKKRDLSGVLSYHLSQTTAQPGETVQLSLSTSEKKTWVIYELAQGGKLLDRQFLKLKRKKKSFLTIPIKESHRGNIQITVTGVKNNAAYLYSERIQVPWTNKQLQLSWSTFRDKLTPGQDEQWKLTIKGPQKEAVAAEMVATLYDASLDVFRSNSFGLDLYPTYQVRSVWETGSGFRLQRANYLTGNNNYYGYGALRRGYDRLITMQNFYGFRPRMARNAPMPMADNEVMALSYVHSADAEMDDFDQDGVVASKAEAGNVSMESEGEPGGASEVSLPPTIRTNLEETAFFFPQLQTDEEGNIVLNFTIPEALTRWKFLGLAHTKELQMGTLGGETVTQKELMVFPNLPRFLREGDELALSAKVSNLTEEDMDGTAEVRLLDAFSLQPIHQSFGLTKREQAFSVKAGQSTPLSWDIKVPENVPALIVQILAKTDKFSDGEENALPILKNRLMVTESIPLAVRGMETKEFVFEKLVASDSSSTLQHQQLTLEFTSNPAWYAVQALPYLMEYPFDCTEQIFSRFYANSLASHVANSSPRIQQVFNQWKQQKIADDGSLLSQLEKNQELKGVLLEETPWVLNARSERERKQRIGLLFDLNRMSNEQAQAWRKLKDRQHSSGAFSWFPGMRPSRYITQLLVTGIGHLQKLGVAYASGNPEIAQTTNSAIQYLDREVAQDYNRLKSRKAEMDKNHLSYHHIQYLYMRTFFKDQVQTAGTEEAFGYYYGQAQTYWRDQSQYMQGMLSLVFHRNGDQTLAAQVLKGLKQSAVMNEALGMYWKDMSAGWFWYQAPIERHALMIEAFNEITKDLETVDELKIWLLKNKQTHDWKTTRATSAAVQALLSTGTNWLEQNEVVAVTLGEVGVDPFQREDTKVEAGTGYFKTAWQAEDIQANMGQIKVSKKDEGIAWGALYWQYFEQLDKITPAATPLSLKKELFVKMNSEQGPRLITIQDNSQAIKRGDRLVVRIELRVDRGMEYVHMKDLRAAAFEPTQTISRYQYKNGLGYYQSTRDVGTDFFFEYLPAGTHVFEYELLATQQGDFSNGITTIQCMYAPEFTSHSEGIRVKVE